MCDPGGSSRGGTDCAVRARDTRQGRPLRTSGRDGGPPGTGGRNERPGRRHRHRNDDQPRYPAQGELEEPDHPVVVEVPDVAGPLPREEVARRKDPPLLPGSVGGPGPPGALSRAPTDNSLHDGPEPPGRL